MGATPLQVGMATSAFSVAQMTMCPLLVAVSSNKGRRATLSVCLAGAALSSTVLAASTTLVWLIVARFVAGIFAAGIPVAQAGVTDLVPSHQHTLALSRVSAASQTGLVVGPIVSAMVQIVLKRSLPLLGVSSSSSSLLSQQALVRCVFGASAVFALGVLAIIARGGGGTSTSTRDENGAAGDSKSDIPKARTTTDSSASLSFKIPIVTTLLTPQTLLRIIALAAGWSLTLSVAIYSLFASRFLGYGQSQLSLTYSAGAATVIATQLWMVPRLVATVGEHVACTLGLGALALGLAGSSLIRWPLPVHVGLYFLIRLGQGVTDTSTATLVARASPNKEERAHNLGMIQSTRAGARIFTPLLSGSLFMRSCRPSFPAPGALPYLVNAMLALALIPLPLVLKRRETKEKDSVVMS